MQWMPTLLPPGIHLANKTLFLLFLMMLHPKTASCSLCGNLDTGSSASIAIRLAPGHWKLIKNKNIPAQIEADDCGFFMIMYGLYMALGWPFDFSQRDIPQLRRWWCRILLENMSNEGMTSCNAPEDASEQDECMKNEPARKVQRVERVTDEGDRMDNVSFDQMPLMVIEDILLDTVLEEGDKAFLKLSLVCRLFRDIVGQQSFRARAHFEWLDSVVPWKHHSAAYKAEFRRMYELQCCQNCQEIYKDCIPGYVGRGRRGELVAFYSENEHPGFCSQFCSQLYEDLGV